GAERLQQHEIYLRYVQHPLAKRLLRGRGLVVKLVCRHRVREPVEHHVVPGPIVFHFAGQRGAWAHESGGLSLFLLGSRSLGAQTEGKQREDERKPALVHPSQFTREAWPSR